MTGAVTPQPPPSQAGAPPRIVPKAGGRPLLQVEDISLSFGGLKALDQVSLEIREGEILAIIGPNGAGKTSLLNVINGVYHPQQGRILFEGQDRTRFRPHQVANQGVARTFQNLGLFRAMTTLENLMTGRKKFIRTNFFLQAMFWGPALKAELEQRKRVEWIIEFLGIEHIRKVPVGTLPYGLQKRVELGRALAAVYCRGHLHPRCCPGVP